MLNLTDKENTMENKDINNNRPVNSEHKVPPRAVRPSGTRPNATRPNAVRPNNQNVRHINNAQNTYSDNGQSMQRRDSIVDVDAENENYFINSMGYDELVDDATTRVLDREEEKQEAKKRTPEQAKKLKIIGISAGSVGALLIAGLVVLNVLKSDPGFTITKVDITGHEPVYITAEQVEGAVTNTTAQSNTDPETSETSETTSAETDTQETTDEPRVERTYSIINPESDKEYNIGNFITKKFQVNSKPVGADEYVVSDTKYDCGLEKVYTDDTVKEIIKQYNENNKSNKEITIDFDSITDSTFIVARVGCQYPEDYPTSNGMAYEIPEVSIKVVGTYIEEETTTDEEASTTVQSDDKYSDKVEVDGKIYTLEAPIAIHDIPDSISVASGYNFDYLIQMPSGAKADSYKLIVTINGQEIIYSGIDVN